VTWPSSSPADGIGQNAPQSWRRVHLHSKYSDKVWSKGATVAGRLPTRGGPFSHEWRRHPKPPLARRPPRRIRRLHSQVFWPSREPTAVARSCEGVAGAPMKHAIDYDALDEYGWLGAVDANPWRVVHR
jgi:hypothetical protein